MNTKTVAIIAFLVVFLSVNADATYIRTDVSSMLAGEMKIMDAPEGPVRLLALKPEFHNTGSIPYMARASVDVLEGGNVIFRGWSAKKTIMPGDRDSLDIVWYRSGTNASYTAEVKAHYADEISDAMTVNFTMEKTKPSDIFRINNFKTYDGYIRFDLKADVRAENITVFADGFYPGWIFEQVVAGSLNAGERKEIVIPYEADIFFERSINITLVSDDLKYYKQQAFSLRKQEGIMKYLNQLADWLGSLFSFLG
jgi:hypothetical protein